MTVNEDGYYKLHIFDLEGNCEVNAPQPPAGAVSSYGTLSWSPAAHRLLFTLSSGKRPENVWLLDLDKDVLRPLTYSDLHGLSTDMLAEPQLLHFRSFDGLEIPFWLYVPHGAERKNLPVVVVIHGGPEGQEPSHLHALHPVSGR